MIQAPPSTSSHCRISPGPGREADGGFVRLVRIALATSLLPLIAGCGGVQTPSDQSRAARPSSESDSKRESSSRAEPASSSSSPSVSASEPPESSRAERRARREIRRATASAIARLHTRPIHRAAGVAHDAASRRAALELPTLYSAERPLSPLTPHVVRHLRNVASRNPDVRDDVFSKVGGSNTVNPNFMQCFAGDDIDLAGRDHLKSTIEFFGADGSGEPSTYTRDSEAAKVGWSALNVMKGDPAHLVRELRDLRPRFALVMYGTNDIGWRSLDAYAEDIFRIVETLTEHGAIPVLTSIPPRDDEPEAAEKVPRFNAVLRGIAQARQIPFIDLNYALNQLPDRGLGGDGLHMTALADRYFQPCVFTDEGLRHGHNTRNLLTIRMLHRLRRTIIDREPPPDALQSPDLRAAGSSAEPVRIESLPFTDGRDTSTGGVEAFDRYPGCGDEADQSGPEFVYRLHLETPKTIRASVVDRRGADLDLHLLTDSLSPSTCRQRADHTITTTLSPGTHYLVVDTFASPEEGPRPGEYVLTVREEPKKVSRRTGDARIASERPDAPLDREMP